MDEQRGDAGVALVLEVPDRGFLRRMREMLYFQERLNKQPSVALLDELTNYLLGFVPPDADKAKARETLLDLSAAQFKSVLKQLIEGEMPPLARDTRSERGSQDEGTGRLIGL